MTQLSIAALVTAARSGRLISFPTDTVPALAARPEAANAIYRAKHRSPDKPLILMAATPEELWPFVQGCAQEYKIWQAMATSCWPGAVTLVLPGCDRIPATVNLSGDTIGLRIPDWPLAQVILQHTGPLATTSINQSNHPPLLSVEDIEAQFPEVLLSKTWPLPVATPQPSTVIQWTESPEWTVLRQGQIDISLLG